MRRLLRPLIVVLAVAAFPASVASQSGLPPGCFWLTPIGPILCLDMPIEP
jgi:hypothetical protein